MDLDPNCGMDPFCCFHMFSQKTAANFTPKLNHISSMLLCSGEFSA